MQGSIPCWHDLPPLPHLLDLRLGREAARGCRCRDGKGQRARGMQHRFPRNPLLLLLVRGDVAGKVLKEWACRKKIQVS